MQNIKELFKKYSFLSKEEGVDFWKCHNSYILTHDAVTKIANYEQIDLIKIESILSTETSARFLITMKDRKGKAVTTVGEASKANCKNAYYGAMAEKWGIDRAVLKLINAYEYGIYSEVEADDFKKPKQLNTKSEKIEPTATEAQLNLIFMLCERLDLNYTESIKNVKTTKDANNLIVKLKEEDYRDQQEQDSF